MKERILIVLVIIAGLTVFGWWQYQHRPSADRPHSLAIHVLDIGQGDSIYLRLPTHDDILIDTGPDDRVVSQLGRFMPPGDREIELLIITHNHLDHIGGFEAVARRYKIDRIWLTGAIHTIDQYRAMLSLIHDQKIPVTLVRAGNLTNIGEVRLLVLHPLSDMSGLDPPDQHDATVVTKLSWRAFCILLTGDLNSQHEAQIIGYATALHESLTCPVLKVTHHGSSFGTSQAWLEAVRPKIAIISVGRHNPFHHPAPSTLVRLQASGAEIYRTDQRGTISVNSDGQDFWTTTAK